jgi:hypothetical protein
MTRGCRSNARRPVARGDRSGAARLPQRFGDELYGYACNGARECERDRRTLVSGIGPNEPAVEWSDSPDESPTARSKADGADAKWPTGSAWNLFGVARQAASAAPARGRIGFLDNRPARNTCGGFWPPALGSRGKTGLSLRLLPGAEFLSVVFRNEGPVCRLLFCSARNRRVPQELRWTDVRRSCQDP